MTASASTPRQRGPVTLAVTSGKGGVGKTNVVVNLAVSLARLHNRVAILDADFGLGNVDVLLGLAPPFHLGHLLSGDKDIHDIVVEGPHGIRIVPASSGLREPSCPILRIEGGFAAQIANQRRDQDEVHQQRKTAEYPAARRFA